jgi:hypothetical protein
MTDRKIIFRAIEGEIDNEKLLRVINNLKDDNINICIELNEIKPLTEIIKPKKITKPRVKKLSNKTILLVEPEEITKAKPEISDAIKEIEASNMNEPIVKDIKRIVEEEKVQPITKEEEKENLQIISVSTKKTSRKKRPLTKTEDKENKEDKESKPETIKKTRIIKPKLKSIEKETENVLESLILNIPETETPIIETSTKPKKSQTTKSPKKNTTKKQKLSFVIEEKTP